jgi:hypothetical protein
VRGPVVRVTRVSSEILMVSAPIRPLSCRKVGVSTLICQLWGSKVGYSGGGRESLCGFLSIMLQIYAKIPKGVSSPRDSMII